MRAVSLTRRALLPLAVAAQVSAAPLVADQNSAAAYAPMTLVPQLTAREHLAKRVAPAAPVVETWPPNVIYVDVLISPTGRVEHAQSLCGTSAYRPAVENDVYLWQFTPFTSAGQPITVRTVVSEFITT